MAKKGAKATRKFAASGQLKKQIQARHKHQQLKKSIERRKGKKTGHTGATLRDEQDEDDGMEGVHEEGVKAKGKQ